MEDSELHFLLFPSLSAPSLVHYITLHFRLTNPVLLTPSASCPCSVLLMTVLQQVNGQLCSPSGLSEEPLDLPNSNRKILF